MDEEPPLNSVGIITSSSSRIYSTAYNRALEIKQEDPDRLRILIDLAQIEADSRRKVSFSRVLLSKIFGRRRYSNGYLNSNQLRAYIDAFNHDI